MTIQLQFIIQRQILCVLYIFMKTVIIVRLYFDHFHILWDYTQKWRNGKIKMMMMMMMMMASSSGHADISIFVTDD